VKRSSFRAKRILDVSWLLLLLIVLPGCGLTSWGMRPQWPSLLHRSARIPADATKEEILAVVNESIVPIHAWRATSARVHVSKVPIPLRAMIAVEQPNHLRMTISSGLSGQSEVEIGSNQQELWFWMRQMEPQAIMAVNHEDLEAVQERFPVPVQPDWLLEVLNVKPIDGANAELIQNPDRPYTVKLVSHVTNSNGQTIRKITTIDLRRGEVTGHELYDAEHRLIAKAELSDYRKFPKTDARLPYEIKMKWAEQDLKLHFVLNGVQINPPAMPSQLWDSPQIAGCPKHRLGRDHLMQSPTSLANRRVRDKPKAITQYELDEPSGAWKQDQYIQLPNRNDETGDIARTGHQQSDSQSPNDSPYFQPQDLAHASSSEDKPVQTTETGGPAPFPDFAHQSEDKAQSGPKQTANNPAWAQEPTQEHSERRSRDELLRY